MGEWQTGTRLEGRTSSPSGWAEDEGRLLFHDKNRKRNLMYDVDAI